MNFSRRQMAGWIVGVILILAYTLTPIASIKGND